MKDIKRGEIYYADLSPIVGSEQGGVCPVLIRLLHSFLFLREDSANIHQHNEQSMLLSALCMISTNLNAS